MTYDYWPGGGYLGRLEAGEGALRPTRRRTHEWDEDEQLAELLPAHPEHHLAPVHQLHRDRPAPIAQALGELWLVACAVLLYPEAALVRIQEVAHELAAEPQPYWPPRWTREP